MHRDDVGVGQARHRLGLDDELRTRARDRGRAVIDDAHELERDRALELRVVRGQYDAHAAGADRALIFAPRATSSGASCGGPDPAPSVASAATSSRQSSQLSRCSSSSSRQVGSASSDQR